MFRRRGGISRTKKEQTGIKQPEFIVQNIGRVRKANNAAAGGELASGAKVQGALFSDLAKTVKNNADANAAFGGVFEVTLQIMDENAGNAPVTGEQVDGKKYRSFGSLYKCGQGWRNVRVRNYLGELERFRHLRNNRERWRGDLLIDVLADPEMKTGSEGSRRGRLPEVLGCGGSGCPSGAGVGIAKIHSGLGGGRAKAVRAAATNNGGSSESAEFKEVVKDTGGGEGKAGAFYFHTGQDTTVHSGGVARAA